MKLRIFFMGDYEHPNARNWIEGLEATGKCEVIAWQLSPMQKHGGRLSRNLDMLKALFNVRRKIRKINPDIVIGYRLASYGFIGALPGFHPLVVAMQGAQDIWPLHSWITPVKRYMVKYAIRKADLIQCWGQHMMDNCVKLGGDPQKILMLPRGINLNLFYPPKDINPPTILKIIVTRALKPEYRHFVILEAAAKLLKAGIPFKLTIIGSGVLMEDIKNRAAELGIGSFVEMTGKIENTKLPELLRESNIYASMPLSEGVSASLFEAMACGCFPVVSDLVANRAWINNGENGLLIDVDDSEMLFRKLAEIRNSPELFKSAVQFNLNLVKNKADLAHNMDQFVQRYAELAGKKE
jgi:glycosyltransferase involved in cell wall biosynthesis